MTAIALADFNRLGVLPSSSVAEVRAARRNLVRSTHPDVSADASADERMALINAAYDRIVAAVQASTDDREVNTPFVHWADSSEEFYAARRMERRPGGKYPYARDPSIIRWRYARASYG